MLSTITKFKVCLLIVCLFFIGTKELPAYQLNTSVPAPEQNAQLSEKQQFKSSLQKKQKQNISPLNPKIKNTWMPYFLHNRCFQSPSIVFANTNWGIGFLYFDGVKGSSSLIKTPNLTTVLKTSKPQGGFVYNKSPLLEASVAWNLASVSDSLSFISMGISFYNQSAVYLQSYQTGKRLDNVPINSVFNAQLGLNALAAKFYFYFPYSLIVKTIAYTPYLSLAAGPSWQTWSSLNLYRMHDKRPILFRQKISANCFFSSELGWKLHSARPDINLSMVLGCKFNLWGKSGYLGKASDQKWRNPTSISPTSAARVYALHQPWSVRMVYQWAPFIGVMWSY